MKVTGIEVPWREGELDFRGVVGTRPTAIAPPSRTATTS
jgi:hypothetical protein